jgi:hypothetical protein
MVAQIADILILLFACLCESNRLRPSKAKMVVLVG